MKISLAKSNQGVALIIVMLVIIVLATLAGNFASSMKVETRLARQASVESDFEWLGRSGVERARYTLAQSLKEPYDSLMQHWAGGPGRGGDTNVAQLPAEFELGSGKGKTRIIDMERKFNINVADPMILQKAMVLIGVDAGTSPEIVDSIQDWIDKDSDEHISGAESDYYQRLNPPHDAKNGWVDNMTELLFVRGVAPEVFWGKSSADHPIGAFQRRDKIGLKGKEQPNYPVGIFDLFTPLSNGKINVNTAPAISLQLIPEIDPNIAAAIIQFRAGPDGQDGTLDDTPFANPGDIVNVPGIPFGTGAQALTTHFSVRSSVFEVHVDCEIGDFKREYIALVYRVNPKDIRILSMYWKGEEGAKHTPTESF